MNGKQTRIFCRERGEGHAGSKCMQVCKDRSGRSWDEQKIERERAQDVLFRPDCQGPGY